MTEENNLEGLRGWLILVGVGILLSPFRIAFLLFQTYSEIFSNGIWEALTPPGTTAYNPLWKPILMGEVTINCGLLLAWLFIAFLFFSKKRLFPKCYISILIFTLIFIIADAMVANIVLPDEPIFDDDTVKEFSRSLIGTLVWIPYMLVSKRVKATFIY